MKFQAFHGDAELKRQTIDRVRAADAGGKLMPMGVLHWDDRKEMHTFAGAMAETEGRDAFQRHTGIPLDLALLIEGIAAMDSVTLPNPAMRYGLEFRYGEGNRAYASEWLEAVRPGADLSDVVPRFMVQFMELVLGDGFDLKAYITPGIRAAAERVLANWKSELAGETVDAKAWRAVRSEAVKANAGYDTAWTYPLAHFVETLAWPVRDIAREFPAPFFFLASNWLAFSRRPHLAEEDRLNSELQLKGHLLANRMEQEGSVGEEEMRAMLETNPDIKRAMSLHEDPVGSARYKEGQLRGFASTTPRVRQLLEQLVRLVAAA